MACEAACAAYGNVKMSRSKVVTIYGDDCDPRKASDQVVKALKDLLERAEAGEIIGVVAVGVDFGANWAGTICAGQIDYGIVTGALQRLVIQSVVRL